VAELYLAVINGVQITVPWGGRQNTTTATDGGNAEKISTFPCHEILFKRVY